MPCLRISFLTEAGKDLTKLLFKYSSLYIGNGPFSSANLAEALYVLSLKHANTFSAHAKKLSDPYGYPNISPAFASPVSPNPILLLFFASSACGFNGYIVRSITLSIALTICGISALNCVKLNT